MSQQDSLPTTPTSPHHPGRIPRHERAPATDAEWEQALRYYVAGRPVDHEPAADTPLSESPRGATAAQPDQLLIHNANDDGFDCMAHSAAGAAHDPQATGPRRPKLNVPFDLSRDFHILGGTVADGSHSTPAVQTPEAEDTTPTFPSFPTLDDLAFTSLQPAASLGAFEPHYRIADAATLPRPVPLTEENHLCAMGERQRLRKCYEEEGWLQAPDPTQELVEKRSRVIRRLGLNEPGNLGERSSVIAKYCELTQLMLGTDGAAVSIFRGDKEDIYLSTKDIRHFSLPLAQGLAGHAVLRPDGRCLVVADMDTDWRFANNPVRLNAQRRKFFAAAPLRFHRAGGDFVDFGALCVACDTSRDTFDVREQSILLRIANMMVYQLATLQSEIMAKQSSTMYEASINFLRRSLVPEQLKPDAVLEPKDANPDSKPSKSKKPSSRSKKNRQAKYVRSGGRTVVQDARTRLPTAVTGALPSGTRPNEALSPTPSHTPALSNRSEVSTDMPQMPRRAVKTAPRDSRRAKRKDLRAETAMFNDAAETLRGILNADAVCMVDLHEYQLYVRKGGTAPESQPTQTKESIVADFLQGKEWPSNIEPVVKYVPQSESTEVEVMGQSHAPGFEMDFAKPNAPDTLAKFAKTYLTTRHSWWDREDPDDELAQEIMAFMPDNCKTVLSTVFLTFNGMLRHAIFVAWERSPCSFDDSSRFAVPFVWIIGAALVSGLAINRMRSVEESQITYSNLQAHELRTPLHQILTITHLLRSSMSDLADAPAQPHKTGSGCMTTLEQVRDLLPLLDAIDTSGKTLHGIVDNILTFLDLTGKDNLWDSSRAKHPALFGHSSGAPQTLRAMLEELVTEAYDEDRRSRAGSGEQQGHIDTVLEFVPKDLGDLVAEDRGGALRRALGRLISNAYRYIDGPGCVEIYVDDIEGYLPPEGCEDLSSMRRVAIHIVDNGRGMSLDFVDNKLGEPWAKEDLFATGSGLSVHLAYRIVDLMGGEMEISSAPGDGCSVSIQVPLSTTTLPSHYISEVGTTDGLKRKVAVLGFDRPDNDPRCGLDRLGASLERQYAMFGCDIVPASEADLVVIDGGYESDETAPSVLSSISASEVVIFETEGDAPAKTPAPLPAHTRVRRLHKPITPTLIRATLSRVPTRPESSNDADSIARRQLKPHFDEESIARSDKSSQAEKSDEKALVPVKPKESRGFSLFGWKSRGMCVEEAVASLCLGDYFSSRGRAARHSSTGSSPSTPPVDDAASTSATSTGTDPPSSPGLVSTSSSPWLTESTPLTTPSDEHEPPLTRARSPSPTPVPEPRPRRPTKVLVVEDNMVNRKILVRILKTSGLDLDIEESEDGQDALERFKTFENPVIVLLDINMPKMDGFTAASEMRLAEQRRGSAATITSLEQEARKEEERRSKIFAITALAGDDEKRRGLVECGMDLWLTKPCPKLTLQKVMEDAVGEIAKRHG